MRVKIDTLRKHLLQRTKGAKSGERVAVEQTVEVGVS